MRTVIVFSHVADSDRRITYGRIVNEEDVEELKEKYRNDIASGGDRRLSENIEDKFDFFVTIKEFSATQIKFKFHFISPYCVSRSN